MESVWHATHQSTPSPDEFVAGAHHDVVVVGAGLTGLTTAVLLSRAGLRVAVIEAMRIGALTTGSTTGKVSLLQGSVLSDVVRHHSKKVLRAYVEGNREGQAWLVRYMEEHGIEFERRAAYTYAHTEQGLRILRDELDACQEAGLDVDWATQPELDDVAGALTMPDQVQIHPLPLLDALVAELRSRGGQVFEGVRVADATSGEVIDVTTDRGEVRADRVVLATGMPILDRGGYFLKLTPLRSYAATYRVQGPIPRGMYLSVDAPHRTLRTVRASDEELLIVGGNGHITGREESAAAALADLDHWTTEHFDGAQRVHAWSAQDYRSINRVPFVGTLPRGGGRIHVATGFNKWGLTNGVAAALQLSAEILDGQMPWSDTLGRRVTKPAGLVSAASLVAGAVGTMASDWVQTGLRALPDEPPAEGEGVVGRGAKGLPEAVSTVDGVTCRVSGVCPHLGGVVRWNDAERSWDCPLHGSRFAPDGTRIEGPAVEDLSPRGAED